MSSRLLQEMSSIRFQNMFSRRLQRNNFSSLRHLETCLEDVSKTSWRPTNVCCVITHTALAHSETNQTSKVEPFANMTQYECLVLKLTIKSTGLVKKAWKWLDKLNILSGGHIWERIIYILEQEIIFILSRGENVQNRNFWKQ